MYLLNTKEMGNREYTSADIKGIKPIFEYGLNDAFYGGRVKRIGLTDTDILLMLDEGMQVVDIGTTNPECLPLESIKFLLNGKKIVHHHKLGKAKLIALLEGREIENEDS